MTNEPHVYTVPAGTLDLSRQDIVHALGYARAPVPDYLPAMIDEAMEAILPLLEIRCGFRIFSGIDAAFAPEEMRCCDTTLSTGRIIASRLRRSTSLALFAATIGSRLETESKRLMAQDDMMSGFLFDTIGSAYAEAAAAWLEAQLAAVAALDGCRITNRYSPGYCQWPVSGQHALFSLLPERFCGITLTDSALMLPIKSVSGIIGIGAHVTHEDYACSVCDMDDCIRKKLTDAHTPSGH